MAYTSGTAANYKDLLAVMATFAAANGWVILEQNATLVYLKGTGLAGLDEIYCGVATYEDAPNNRYNWNMFGSWGWRSGRDIWKHPKNSNPTNTAAGQVVTYLWNDPIPYWMVCTPRRIIVVAKVGTTYQATYLGLLTPPATDAQYPYPLLVGGSGVSLTQNSSGTLNSFWSDSIDASLKLSCPGGGWGYRTVAAATELAPALTVDHIYKGQSGNIIAGLDGSYLLEPVFLRYTNSDGILGHMEGIFRVSGYNNTAENIITVDGVNYMVFPDGSRSGYGDYCAMRLS